MFVEQVVNVYLLKKSLMYICWASHYGIYLLQRKMVCTVYCMKKWMSRPLMWSVLSHRWTDTMTTDIRKQVRYKKYRSKNRDFFTSIWESSHFAQKSSFSVQSETKSTNTRVRNYVLHVTGSKYGPFFLTTLTITVLKNLPFSSVRRRFKAYHKSLKLSSKSKQSLYRDAPIVHDIPTRVRHQLSPRISEYAMLCFWVRTAAFIGLISAKMAANS